MLFRSVVIPFHVSDEEKLASIEEAVAIIADPENQPVLVHCWAGAHRTGAVIGVYRVSHCGWPEESARVELERWGGSSRGTRWPGRILHAYCSRHQAAAARGVGDLAGAP